MDETPDSDDLPATVSNQNQEEAEPGHDDGSERRAKRPPGSDDASDRPSGGEAGEGSQSTGHPDSAG